MVAMMLARGRFTLILLALAIAVPVAARASSLPLHVETWAGYRYGGVDEGIKSPPSTMQRWVTYLDGGWPFNKHVCDVPGHPCKTVDYIDASNEYFGACGWSAAVVYGGLTQEHTLAESAWLHVRPPLTYATRIFNNRNNHCVAATPDTGLFVNKKSTSGPGNALAYFNAFMQNKYRDGWPDYLMDDDVDVFNDLWPTGLAAYEYTSWVDLQNAQAAFLGGEVRPNGQPQPLFFNGCSSNPAAATAVNLIKMRPNILGCITESNVNAKSIRNGRVEYSLDNCARVTLSRNGGIFVNGPDEDGGMLARRQSTAFNMLCYVPGREVFWEEEEWGGKYVNVFPEASIYPAQPLESMQLPGRCPDATISDDGQGHDGSQTAACTAHGHNDLLVGGLNVERREFGKCAKWGAPAGGCAVIWNLSDSPVSVRASWLKQRYSHEMQMIGGTIDEGGAITLTEHADPAHMSIPPYDALFLFQ